MKFLDDTSNRIGSDAGQSNSGQNAQSSSRGGASQDDGYKSNNPRQIPSEDSGYNFANEKFGQKDPEFQSAYRNKQKGGLAKQAGRAVGKSKSAIQQKAQGASDQLNKINDIVSSSKGDPSKITSGLANEYLHAGEKIGTALWIIWGASAIISAFPFIITAIPGAIMFNLLLISPKWNYRITLLILDLFGVGEAIQAGEKFVVDKDKITISSVQKGIIIAYDIILLILLLAVFTIFIAIVSWWVCSENMFASGSGSLVQQGALKVLDWWYDTNYSGAVTDMCNAVKSVTGVGG